MTPHTASSLANDTSPQQTTAAIDERIIAGFGMLEKQLGDFLDKMSPQHYQHKSGSESSIGEHMRHTIEFMEILGRSIGQEAPEPGVVDYDSRKRNALYQENPQAACQAMRKALANLASKIEKVGHICPLIKRASPGFGVTSVETASTLGTESTAMIEHSIHHMAMMKLAAERLGISVSHDFGMAPATRAHQQALEVAGQGRS